MADLFGEYELASSAGISGNLGDLGGVSLSGLPNVGKGPSASRSGKQKVAVKKLHQGLPSDFGPDIAPQPQPQASQTMQGYGFPRQQGGGDWLHPMQRQGLNQYQSAMQATNDAISREMDSRVSQARDAQQRLHEQQMASMKHGADMARTNAEMQMRRQELASKQSRNNALMRAAGFSPLRQSLLG